MNVRSVLTLFLFCCGSSPLFAQETLTNTGARVMASYPQTYFTQAMGRQSALYNGQEYQPYLPFIQGSAYFQEVHAFTKGTVTYDGVDYPGVFLEYDQVKDQLVSLLYNGVTEYSLVSDKVSDFYLNDHHFIYLTADSADKKAPFRSGFFDLLYDGQVKVITKTTKTIQTINGYQDITTYFSSKTMNYLEKDQAWFAIGSEKDFFARFRDRKKEMQQYLKRKGVVFRKSPQQALVLLAAYADGKAD